MTANLGINIQCDDFQWQQCGFYLKDLIVLEYFGLYSMFSLNFTLSVDL